MDYTTLGGTGLRVSRMGLGCGGPSRLGLKTGSTENEAERVVREALALGVNFIDTAESYGTEEVVGRGIQGTSRGQVLLSTKAGVHWNDRRCTAAELKERLEASLRRLRTEYVDVYHLHGVSVEDYAYARDELRPAAEEMRAQGKLRAIGITEAFGQDPGHRMLSEAVRDFGWDVVMVGFNILNQSARDRVLALTQEKNIGTLCMFAVRRALSRQDALQAAVADLAARGQIDPGDFDPADPLAFAVGEQAAASLLEAAYRYCRWEPGMDVILSGTSSVAHLRENAASIEMPPLPSSITERLRRMFARADSIAGN